MDFTSTPRIGLKIDWGTSSFEEVNEYKANFDTYKKSDNFPKLLSLNNNTE